VDAYLAGGIKPHLFYTRTTYLRIRRASISNPKHPVGLPFHIISSCLTTNQSATTVTKDIKDQNTLATRLYTSSYFTNVIKLYYLMGEDNDSLRLNIPVMDDCPIVSFAVE